MKLTVTYNGKPIELELTAAQVEVLKQTEKKETGWERVEKGEKYYLADLDGEIVTISDDKGNFDNTKFDCANYLSDETLAKNIIRAQTLQRKLWRRSAELCEKANWNNSTAKFSIYYDYYRQSLSAQELYLLNAFGQVYFDTKEHVEQVMDEFHDELIWYFTKFQSRMD